MSLADELLADLEEGGDNLETNPDAEEPEEVTEVTEDIVMEVDTGRNSVRSVGCQTSGQ